MFIPVERCAAGAAVTLRVALSCVGGVLAGVSGCTLKMLVVEQPSYK